eukprot:6192982-Pleurochrysis_carterae.AAC.2
MHAVDACMSMHACRCMHLDARVRRRARASRDARAHDAQRAAVDKLGRGQEEAERLGLRRQGRRTLIGATALAATPAAIELRRWTHRIRRVLAHDVLDAAVGVGVGWLRRVVMPLAHHARRPRVFTR